MIKTSQIFGYLFAIILALLTGCSTKHEDKVIDVADDDPDMIAAIVKARSTLPQFWAAFDKPEHGENGFALKVKITDANGSEHFWATDLERHEGKIIGTINNDAEIVKSVKLGDRIPIPEADISDWLYLRDDKMYGNETIKPLFKHMSAGEVAKAKSMMANPDP